MAGAVLATLGMTALVFGIVNSADAGWTSPITVSTLAAGAILLILLFLNEARAEQPIMPLRLFRSREPIRRLCRPNALSGCHDRILLLHDSATPRRHGLQRVPSLSIAFFPMTIVNFAVAMLIPRLTPRFGNSTILSVGIAVTLTGMAWLSLVIPAARTSRR